MSDRTFVDTNVLIYAHDVDAKAKHAVAKNVLRELWSQRTGALSLQASYRRGHESLEHFSILSAAVPGAPVST